MSVALWLHHSRRQTDGGERPLGTSLCACEKWEHRRGSQVHTNRSLVPGNVLLTRDPHVHMRRETLLSTCFLCISIHQPCLSLYNTCIYFHTKLCCFSKAWQKTVQFIEMHHADPVTSCILWQIDFHVIEEIYTGQGKRENWVRIYVPVFSSSVLSCDLVTCLTRSLTALDSRILGVPRPLWIHWS